MKRFMFLLTLTACVPTATPTPLPENPKITFECKENGLKTTIHISSFTPVYLPELTVPRFPDGTVPVRYQFKDFTGMSEVLNLTWCPINATLEYSRKEGGERFKVGGP